MQETQNMVQYLSREDHLEEAMATHSSILTWKIPRTEEPGGLHPKGSQWAGNEWVTKNTPPHTQCSYPSFILVIVGME